MADPDKASSAGDGRTSRSCRLVLERQPEKPPPEKQQRPAPDPKSQPPLSPLSNKQNLYNSRSAPRRKRRQNQPSFRVVKIARRFLAPERRS